MFFYYGYERMILMSDVSILRDVWLEELKTGVRTTQQLFSKIEPQQWSYRPRENMISLLELARHLALSPMIHLAILQEQSEEEVHSLEKTLNYQTAEQLSTLMEKGYHEVESYMKGLSTEDFLHKKTRPFYLDYASTQSKWLVEIVTHVFHHRAQLFNYLKQLGHPVNMFDLY